MKIEKFTICIEVETLEQLEGLWLISNSNVLTEEFIQNHPQRCDYAISPHITNPLTKQWRQLQSELSKYNKTLETR